MGAGCGRRAVPVPTQIGEPEENRPPGRDGEPDAGQDGEPDAGEAPAADGPISRRWVRLVRHLWRVARLRRIYGHLGFHIIRERGRRLDP